MKRSSLVCWLICLAALACVTTGCGPDAKQKKITDLTAENEQLKRSLDDKERQLNEMLVQAGDARKTIDDLNGELDRLRTAGATKKGEGGWMTGIGFDMISIPGSVLFDSGKSELKSSGRQTLEKIASDIKARYSDRDIYVFGHTDDEPIRKSRWKDNWELGAGRALAVVRQLQSSGVRSDRLIQANCSQYRPKASNRMQNRRVEFYAVVHKETMAAKAPMEAVEGSD